MMYCGVDEAFNTQINKPIINKRNIEDGLAPPLFTAQGDLSNEGGYFDSAGGTPLSEIRRQIYEPSIYDDSLSLLDSQSSDSGHIFNQEFNQEFKQPVTQGKPKVQIKRSHNYYIKKFMLGFIDDGSLSMSSTQDNDVYDHIKSCKYCRSQINKKMKKHYSKSKNQKNDIVETFTADKPTICGYDLKEILVVILIGIVLIFLLDLFVKIGKNIS